MLNEATGLSASGQQTRFSNRLSPSVIIMRLCPLSILTFKERARSFGTKTGLTCRTCPPLSAKRPNSPSLSREKRSAQAKGEWKFKSGTRRVSTYSQHLSHWSLVILRGPMAWVRSNHRSSCKRSPSYRANRRILARSLKPNTLTCVGRWRNGSMSRSANGRLASATSANRSAQSDQVEEGAEHAEAPAHPR